MLELETPADRPAESLTRSPGDEPGEPLPLISSRPLAGECVSFTGTLASMTHRQAFQVVEEQGGTAAEHVSRQTTMLVIGEEGWPLEGDGKTSVKLQQALKLQEGGQPLRLVKESEWLDFVGLKTHQQQLVRQYTPAMLSQLLRVSVGEIRRWARIGLITPVSRVYRLPYFDFQEVASARRLAELLAAGVSAREIQSSLERLHQLLGNGERPLAQLEILSRKQDLVFRDEQGRLQSVGGQFLFDFEAGTPHDLSAAPRDGSHTAKAGTFPEDRDDSKGMSDTSAVVSLETIRLAFPARSRVGQAFLGQPGPSPEEWFLRGCRWAEEGELSAAIEAFRLSLMDAPNRPETHFHLAELLYRTGNSRGALERYFMAVELEGEYIEAWTQIGCLYLEFQEPQAAREAFEIALTAHPDYPDAHFHLADALQRLQEVEAAREHWQRYLEFDSRGPWADLARQHLGLPIAECSDPETNPQQGP